MARLVRQSRWRPLRVRETRTAEVDVEWWRNATNVVELARWLDDRCEFPDTAAVIGFFEKPQKWTPEWRLMQAELEAEAAAA